MKMVSLCAITASPAINMGTDITAVLNYSGRHSSTSETAKWHTRDSLSILDPSALNVPRIDKVRFTGKDAHVTIRTKRHL
jgi:hypothetical protein